MLVLDVFGIEVGVLPVGDCRLKFRFQPVAHRAETTVAWNHSEIPGKAITEVMLDVAGGALRDIGIGESQPPLTGELVPVDVERVSGVALRISVYDRHGQPELDQTRGKASCRGGLAASPFLVGHGNDVSMT